MSRRRYVIAQPRGSRWDVVPVGAPAVAPPMSPAYVRASLPNRMLRIRRGRFFTPVRLAENNSPQALPPQYMRASRTHQKMRRTDRGRMFTYPVLQTAPGPTPTPPPDQNGGALSPGWRRRRFKSRRRAMITGIPDYG